MGGETIDREATDRLLRATTEFGRLDDAARSMVIDELELRVVAAGETVIHQGDPADGLYLVAGGRLQVVYTAEDGERSVLAEAGYGSVAGEMALLDDAPRSADVVALRECHLLFLSSAGFQRVIAAHPEALRLITSALVRKLAATARGRPRASAWRSIAVVPLDPDGTADEFVRAMTPAFARLVASYRTVTRADADAELGADASPLQRAGWFEHLETTNESTIYVADAEASPWTLACLEHADVVLFVARARSTTALRPVETLLERPGVTATRRELVLVHDPGTDIPRNTRAWLASRALDAHHHVRAGSVEDAARVVRLLLGKAIGAVFGGGGARGIAHIGVLRALIDHGVPIDATGGTSIGSIIAGAVARGFDPDQTSDLLRAAVLDGSPVDLTLPTVSLAAGGRVTERIRTGADGLDLEDGWLNCFCVSTNLTRGVPEIHTHGPGWKAVRASFSVPGIFPPVPNDAGEMLVDGGLLDNLPVGVMRRRHRGIRVIAVDVGAVRESLTAPIPTTGVLSGWGYLWSQLRTRSYGNLAGLPRILMRLTELGAQAEPDLGDCPLRPATSGVSLMNFKAFDELVEIGYRDAHPAIAKWLAGDDRPQF
ncbi:MAG: patatin-like phospholipase family protein [Acidimicrobiia bacterium]